MVYKICFMEKIVLEVSNDIARKWDSASTSKRNKILTILNEALDLIEKEDENVVPENRVWVAG